jgi:hypothetical protein
LPRVGLIVTFAACFSIGLAGSAEAQPPPTVSTGQVVAVTTTGAIVNITVNPQGTDTYYQVLYGPTGGPLTSMTGFQDAGSGTSDIVETVSVDQLAANTSYTYQASVFQNATGMATTDPTTGSFMTTTVPTGPGTPLIPPQNPQTNGIFGYCSTDAECLANANGVRALQEGLPPLALPSNWATLTGPEQLFVYTNLERTSRGEAPITNLVNTYDSDVQTGVQNDADPGLSSFSNGNATSIWAGAFATPLGALYGWLYNDGPGGANLDCTTPTSTGCWGHRDNILDNPGGTIGNPTEMDAVVGTDNNGSTGYAALFVNNPNPTPDGNVVFSWASEQQFLAPPSLGGVTPHGPVPKDRHLAFKPSTFKAAGGHKSPAVIVDTQLRKHTGTIVSYTDSQAASTTFTVKHGLAGVISHGKCVAAPRHGRRGAKRCTRYMTLGSFSHADVHGANRFRFMGRLNGLELKPGKYLMTAVPRSRTGRRGAAVQHTFKIV